MNQFDHLKESLRDYLDHGGETVDLIDAATDVLAEGDCDEYGPWLVGELQRITERMEWKETGRFPAPAKTTALEGNARAPLIRCPVCGSSNVSWDCDDLAVEDSTDHRASLPAGCDEPECGAEWIVWLEVIGYTLMDAGAGGMSGATIENREGTKENREGTKENREGTEDREGTSDA